jgi:hypothetical protein
MRQQKEISSLVVTGASNVGTVERQLAAVGRSRRRPAVETVLEDRIDTAVGIAPMGARHVFRQCGVATADAAAHVAGDALTFMEQLDRALSDAHLDLFLPMFVAVRGMRGSFRCNTRSHRSLTLILCRAQALGQRCRSATEPFLPVPGNATIVERWSLL